MAVTILNNVDMNKNQVLNFRLENEAGSTLYPANPVEGLLVMDTQTHEPMIYDGTSWKTLGGGTADAVEWANVLHKPTTIAGYGITDAGTAAKKDVATSPIADDTTNADLVTSQQVATYVKNKVGTGAMHYLGESSTAITDGGNENPTISGTVISTKHAGDVVLYGNNEYIYNSQNKWELFGAEGEYVLKTQKINGHALSGDVTLALSDLDGDSTHRTVTDAEKSTWNNKQDAIPANTYDAYGAAAGVQSNLNIHTFNGDIHVTATQKTAWSGKQDAISDLATIRSGAAQGATSVQYATGTIAAGYTSGSVAFTGTPVAVSVWTASGDMVITDVAKTSTGVTCTIAAAQTGALTIRVAYI